MFPSLYDTEIFLGVRRAEERKKQVSNSHSTVNTSKQQEQTKPRKDDQYSVDHWVWSINGVVARDHRKARIGDVIEAYCGKTWIKQNSHTPVPCVDVCALCELAESYRLKSVNDYLHGEFLTGDRNTIVTITKVDTE